jgi:hypothetical protein
MFNLSIRVYLLIKKAVLDIVEYIEISLNFHTFTVMEKQLIGFILIIGVTIILLFLIWFFDSRDEKAELKRRKIKDLNNDLEKGLPGGATISKAKDFRPFIVTRGFFH